MSGERQVPFFCPYCGDEDLRPAGADAGLWRCTSCTRGFELHARDLTASEVTP